MNQTNRLEHLKLGSLTIAYRVSPGSDATIVLLHGNSCSSATFAPQLDSYLGEKYQLISLDFPGHGLSSPAPDPSIYGLSGYAKIVAEFVDVLHLENIFLVGCSLGGHVALQISTLLQNIKGIMTFGAPPLNNPLDIEPRFFPTSVIDYVFAPQLNREETRLFASFMLAPGKKTSLQPLMNDIAKTVPEARPNLGKSIGKENYHDEVQLVSELSVPLAILHGEQDQLVDYTYYSSLEIPCLWRKSIQIVKDTGHFIQWEHPTAFNGLLDEFIVDVSLA